MSGAFGQPPLLKHLESDNDRSLIIRLRNAVAPILANNVLRHFTDHSVAHSDHLTEYVDKLAHPLQQSDKRLTAQELIILYSACYLHDIGIQFENAGNTSVIANLKLNRPWDDLDDLSRQDLLRKHHHLISAEMVRTSVRASDPIIGMQLTSEYDPSRIACLCEAHNLWIPEDSERYDALVKDGPNIRMRLLSGFLRMADILDESRRRAVREKGRTLDLPIKSQAHWWRHYYTENVTFEENERSIVIWFDFPPDQVSEFRSVVPALQVPAIQAELHRHNAVFTKFGINWSLETLFSAKEHSDTESMPNAVMAFMLSQLHAHHMRLEALQKQTVSTVFKEGRPHISRRLEELKSNKDELTPADYLIAISKIADDLWSIGSKRSAVYAISFEYQTNSGTLSIDTRVEIGTRLLEMMVEIGSLELVDNWVLQLQEDCHKLPAGDPRIMSCLSIVAESLARKFAYPEAIKAISDAIAASTERRQISKLKADAKELHFLRGQFPQVVVPDADGLAPSIRELVVECRAQAMLGHQEDSLTRLRQAIDCTPTQENDARLVLLMALCEILHLDYRDDEAYEICTEQIDKLVSNAPEAVAIAVSHNRNDIAFDLFQVEDFYGIVDRSSVSDVELWNYQAIYEANEAAVAGKHYSALPIVWQELLRTYRQGCWRPYRTASRFMAIQCLQLGWPQEAVYHAVVARSTDIAKSIGDWLLNNGMVTQLNDSVGTLIECSHLKRHFSIACEILLNMSDAIPDEKVNDIFRRLLPEASALPQTVHERSLCQASWKVLNRLSHRFDANQAQKLMTAATTHDIWTLRPQEGRIPVIRDVMMHALRKCADKLPPQVLNELVEQTVPLVLDRRHDCDYDDAIQLLCTLTACSGDTTKSTLRAQLYPKGQRLSWPLLQAAVFFEVEVKNLDGLVKDADVVERNIRRQVQRVSPGTPIEGIAGTYGYQTVELKNETVYIHIASPFDLEAIIRHRHKLPQKTINSLIDAIIAMVLERENFISNRIALVGSLACIGDVCDEDDAIKIFEALSSLARGEFQEPEHTMSAAEAANPLNPFKMNSGDPNTLRGVALYALACIERDKKGFYGEKLDSLLELCLTDVKAEVRRLAYEAARVKPKLTDAEFTSLLLATRDTDSNAAQSAFTAIANKKGLKLKKHQWSLLVHSVKLATTSREIPIRRAGAFACSNLLKSCPRGPLKISLAQSQELFLKDTCYSVRRDAALK